MAAEKTNQGQNRQFISILSQVGTVATAITALIQAFKGESPGTDYQQTIAASSMLAFAGFLWLWRWPRITKNSRRSKKTGSIIESLLRPFRNGSNKGYVLSINRRRFEGVFLVLTTITMLVSSAGRAPRVAEEISGLKCFYAESDNAPLLVIYRFDDQTQGGSTFENRLYTRMFTDYRDQLSVCLNRRVIEVGSELDGPGRISEVNQSATIVIWGNIDTNSILIHIMPQEWTALPMEIEADATDAGEVESWSRKYIPEIVLGWVEFIGGRNQRAIHVFKTTIGDLELEPWADDNEETLAGFYFLLGQLYSESDAPQLEPAIQAYSKVLEYNSEHDDARLFRGTLYVDSGEYDKAIADFNILIAKVSPLSAEAYVNLAALQEDWESQKNYLWKAVSFSDNDPYYSHILGLSALEAGDYESAISAYDEARHHITDEETRLYFIEDLQAMAAGTDEAELIETVEHIVSLLNE